MHNPILCFKVASFFFSTQTIPPADDAPSAASECIKTAEEKASEIPATEDLLVSPGLTSYVSEYLATEEISVHEDMGTDIISPVASLTVNTAEEEICIIDGLVLDAPPLAGPVEEPISFTKTASPAPDGLVQAQTFTELALDPLLDPSEDRTPVLQPAVEKVQEIQATGLSVKPEDNLELVTPPGAELRLSFTDTAPSEDSTTGQEAHLGGVDDPAENLDAELDEEARNRFYFFIWNKIKCIFKSNICPTVKYIILFLFFALK